MALRLSRPALLIALATGCAPPRNAGTPATQRAATNAAPEPGRAFSALSEAKNAEAPRAARLIVNSQSGILEYDWDGEKLAQLSTTPATAAVVAPDGKSLYFLRTGDSALLRLDLDVRGETLVARLPTTFELCTPSDDSAEEIHEGPLRLEELAVQEAIDFRFASDERSLFLRLQDRNLNMMSYAVELLIDSRNGRTRGGLTFPRVCGESVPEEFTLPSGIEKPRAELAAPNDHPYRVEDGRVHGPSEFEREIPPGDCLDGSSSPSGTWRLLFCDHRGGDYLYYTVILFNRDTGELVPIRRSPSEKVRPQKIESVEFDAESFESLTVVGETTVFWHPERDVLVVGNLLVIPGEKVVELEGEPLLL